MTSQAPLLRFLQHPLGRMLCYLLAYLLIVEPILWTLPPGSVEVNPLKWFGWLTQQAEAADPIDETLLQNVDDKTTVTLSAFRYNRVKRTYFGSATVTNTSLEALPKPMYLVVNAITPDSVKIVNQHGTTVSGKPYYDISSLILGDTLAPGAITNPLTMELTNPNGVQFQMDLSVYATGAPAPNNPPVVISTPITLGTEGVAYSYDVDATDADSDPLTFSLTTFPEGMTIDANTGLITWTPINAQVGDNNVVVQVSDGRGGIDTQSFTIAVSNVNDPPVITSTPITTATEDTLYTYDVEATDPDVGDALTYFLTTSPTGMTIDSATGLIQWTPTNEQVDDNNVTVQVADIASATDTQSFTITVANVNDPPVITSTPVTTATENLLYTYDVEVADPDVGDVLTYSLTTSPTGMTIDSGTGLIQWTPSALQAGNHNVTVQVSDGKGGTDTQSFTIVVAEALNVPPQITSTPITTGTEGVAYTYDVEATDVDGDALTYSLTTLPAGMTIVPATGVIDWTPFANQAGAHSVTVQVVDGRGGSDTQSFTITVAEALNVPPMIISTPVTIATEGLLYTYDVNATDADNDTLTYSLTTYPSGMTINASTGLISWNPSETQTGNYNVVVQVTDGRSSSDTQSYTIDVAEAINNPPIAVDDEYDAREGQTLSVDAPGVMTNDTDPDNDPLTATPVTLPAKGTLDLNPDGSFDYTPDVPPLGTLDFALKYKYGLDEAGGDSIIVQGHPLVVDLDSNDVPDIFFLTGYRGDNKLVALRGDTGEMLYKRTHGGPVFSANGRNAAGDLDLDGGPEIVGVGYENGRGGTQLGLKVVAYEHTGDIKWSSEALPNRYFHSSDPSHATNDGIFSEAGVIIADIDMDGTPEVVVGHGFMNVVGVTVFDNGGQKRWTRIGTRTKGESNPSGLPVVADIDLDGEPEIVYNNTAYSHTGEVLWVANVIPYVGTGSVVANLDDDPFAEVVLWDRYKKLTVLEHNGSIKWQKLTGAYATYESPITIADVDNDGRPEIAVAQQTAYTVLERDGTVQWQNPIVHSRHSAATVFDFDRDGFPEVAFRDNDGIIKIWDGRDGSLKNEFDTGLLYGKWYTFPIMADVDADGHAEMVLAGPDSTVYGGLYVYESINDDWGPMRSIWNQWQYHVTNVNPDGTIPVYVQPHWLIPGLNNFRINERLPEEREERFDQFTYKVNDGEFDSNEATVYLRILPLANPPEILSTPVQTATAGFPYVYNMLTYDPDPGDVHTFSLTAAPAGMTIETIGPTAGRIAWTPDVSQVGSHQVGITVEDLQELRAFQSFTIEVGLPVTVPNVVGMSQTDAESAITTARLMVGSVTMFPSETAPVGMVTGQNPSGGALAPLGSAVNLVVSSGPDTEPPLVEVTANPVHFDAGGSTTITVAATDNGEIVSRSLKVNGVDVPLFNGQATFSTDVPGSYTAIGTATDAAGNEGQDSTEFFVSLPGDTEPPTVAITSPAYGADITEKTNIIGTATDDNFYRYVLELSRDNGWTWAELTVGTAPVINGVLGILDPTILINDIYLLRLRAQDLGGRSSVVTIQLSVDSGNLKIGQFTLSFVDLSIPVSGIPVSIIRTYDSRDKFKHDFGIGWQLSIKTTEVREDDDMNVFITLPDGQRVIFAFTPQFLGTMFPRIPLYRPAYTAVMGGVRYELTCPQCSSIEVTDYWGPWIDPITFEDYDPDTYILTALDGTEYTIDQDDGLQEVRDANDNTLTFTPNGIIHSSGKSIVFVRDSDGRITQIIDPMSNAILYAYDANGDLVSVTDQEGGVSQFTYDNNHYLIDIITPEGVRASRSEYDENGRLIATIDAYGNRIEFTHNLDSRQEVITDRRGYITVYEYDTRGNIIAQADTPGNTTAFTYDANNNKTSETDPLGNTTTYTYDAHSNLLTETDPLGNTTAYTYNALGQVLTTTDPLGNVTTNTYDANGNLLSITDPLGNTTTFTYDARGNLLSTTDPLGNVTSFAYDTFGNLISQTDPLGNTTTYTYDANGNQLTQTVTRTTPSGPEVLTTNYIYDRQNRLIETIDSYGNSTTTEYNSIGKRSATTDKNGNRTTYAYDARGNLASTTYPDGTTETSTYDANSNRITSTNRAGRTTTYTYDAVNRLISTSFPDGSSTSTTYDAAGRLLTSTDALGNTTTYGYDAAGRRITITNSLGNVSTSAYDGNGNQVAFTDANGNSTAYEYDANNLRTKTIFADGTFTTTAYDTLGRRIAETDQAGITTSFTYDVMGKLTAVTDALGQVTSYTYDELGNRISQTDANGNTTNWDYDGLGRTVKRILPLGMSETYTYDAVGNMVSKTDFNGDTTTFTYDVNNRLGTKIFPDSSSVSYTYTATGQRSTVTDSRGVTTYSHDTRDRLTQAVNPDGSSLSYTYDAVGNRTSVIIPSGATTYTYDVLNRLATVTDSDGGITTYAYDNVGNRASVTYPNGTISQYTYDALNRLIRLENLRSDSSVISSYDYTLGPAGNRVRVVENTGRTVDYTYDALYRLVEEDITDPVLGNQTISYTYDPVGNRLTKTDANGTTYYTYDANDRLLIEGSNTYTYDNNGNTLSKTEDVHTTLYEYDYENRLVSAQNPTSVISYEYDVDGIRTSSVVDGTVIGFIVDKNRPYAQVSEEIDGIGLPKVSYVYGDDLISQKRDAVTSYYHYDGQTSTRQLTDATGIATDTYDYDAFGRLLDIGGSTPNTYLYRGEQFDPTIDNYYLRARYYNQDSGRFLTADPFDGDANVPMSLHRYLYAYANPVNRMDPSGRFAVPDVVLGQITFVLANIGVPMGDKVPKAKGGEAPQITADELKRRVQSRLEKHLDKEIAKKVEKRLAEALGTQWHKELYKRIVSPGFLVKLWGWAWGYLYFDHQYLIYKELKHPEYNPYNIDEDAYIDYFIFVLITSELKDYAVVPDPRIHE